MDVNLLACKIRELKNQAREAWFFFFILQDAQVSQAMS